MIDKAVGAGVYDQDLLLDREGLILALLENLHQPAAAIDLSLGRLVQVRTELRKGRHLAVLSEVEAEAPSHLLHCLNLRVATDPGDRNAGVDRRTHAGIKEVAFEKNLAIGDRDHIGRDIGGDVTGLGFDDGEGRQRAAAAGIAQLRGPLQETRVEVKDISRKGLPARGTAQEKRELAVGHGVLGEIIVDQKGMAAIVAHMLSHRTAAVRSDILERGRLRGAGRNNDRVVHGAVLPEPIHYLSDGGELLPNGDIDADDIAPLLVNDGVDRQGRLTGLPIADYQLPLSPSDGDHRINRLKPGLQRLFDRLARDNSGRLELDPPSLFGLNRAAAVDRLS